MGFWLWPFEAAEPPRSAWTSYWGPTANFSRLQFRVCSRSNVYKQGRDRNRFPITEVSASAYSSSSSSFQRVPCAQKQDNGTGRASVGHISQASHFLASSILLTSQGEWRRLICSCLTLNVIYTGRAGCVNFHCEPDPPDQIIQSHPNRKKRGEAEGKKNRNPKAAYAENSNEEAFVVEKAAFIYSHHRYSNRCLQKWSHKCFAVCQLCGYISVFLIYMVFF